MTIENFNYRTNEMLLRNQLEVEGKYGIPKISKFDFKNEDLENLRLIGFDVVKSGKDEHFNRIVHFFFTIINLSVFGKNLINISIF